MVMSRAERNAKQKQRLTAAGIKRVTLMLPIHLVKPFFFTVEALRNGTLPRPTFYVILVQCLTEIKRRMIDQGLPIPPERDPVIWLGYDLAVAKKLFGEDFRERVEEVSAAMRARDAAEAEREKSISHDSQNPDLTPPEQGVIDSHAGDEGDKS